LGAAAIKHKFIDFPIKIQIFHRKNTPVHWGENYPIKQECSLVQKCPSETAKRFVAFLADQHLQK